MNTRLIAIAALSFIAAFGLHAQENPSNKNERFHKAFREDFDKAESKYFVQRRDRRDEATDFRYFPANVSLSEKGTDVMLYRIDPDDPAGAGRGPEIISKHYTSYGSYSARIRIPDVTKVQPNVGAVVGYFTYNMEKGKSLSEIVSRVEELMDSAKSYLMPDDFAYLRRGGRLSPLVSYVGQTINLAPAMTQTDDGTQLSVAGVRRGFASAIKYVAGALEKRGVGAGWRIYITHGAAPEKAEQAKKILLEKFPAATYEILPLSPAFITQGGPSCVAVQVIRE